MKTILKSGYEKIIRLFYLNKKQEIHLRDIARKAKLNENSASRFLNQMESDMILESRAEGNLKKYSINKNSIAFSIFSIFDVEKYLKLPSIRRNAIIYFLAELEEKPVISVLFGSTAKENFAKNSDIDLLLIVNKKINTKKAEDYAEAQAGIKINCIQIRYSDFLKEIRMKEDNVVQSAIETGYPITNHFQYYWEVFRWN